MCRRKDELPSHIEQPKKPRLVFTDLQRRTLQAIFKVIQIIEKVKGEEKKYTLHYIMCFRKPNDRQKKCK